MTAEVSEVRHCLRFFLLTLSFLMLIIIKLQIGQKQVLSVFLFIVFLLFIPPCIKKTRLKSIYNCFIVWQLLHLVSIILMLPVLHYSIIEEKSLLQFSVSVINKGKCTEIKVIGLHI